MLISGSEVTAPRLLVSNANGTIGLVGFWDGICFDAFAGKDKKVDKRLVDSMKNSMANRTFSLGIEQLESLVLDVLAAMGYCKAFYLRQLIQAVSF